MHRYTNKVSPLPSFLVKTKPNFCGNSEREVNGVWPGTCANFQQPYFYDSIRSSWMRKFIVEMLAGIYLMLFKWYHYVKKYTGY